MTKRPFSAFDNVPAVAPAPAKVARPTHDAGIQIDDRDVCAGVLKVSKEQVTIDDTKRFAGGRIYEGTYYLRGEWFSFSIFADARGARRNDR